MTQSRSLGHLLRMLNLRNERVHGGSRKSETLSIVKDFQNLLDSFFCAPYTFPLLLSWWRENQGRGDIFQDSCHVSLLLWKSLRFQRPRGNSSQRCPAGRSAPTGMLWPRCPGGATGHSPAMKLWQRLAGFSLLFNSSSFKGKCKVLFNLIYLNKKNQHWTLVLENSCMFGVT